ncbi:MAG TPA: hypothetical protein VGB99_18670 [Acidobacteriota bacterium]
MKGFRSRAALLALVGALVAFACSRPAPGVPQPLRRDAEIGWIWSESFEAGGRSWSNALGLRDRPHLPRPAAGALRILVVGDQRALEPGVPELAIPQLVEQALWMSDPSRDWELINAGVVGYGPAQVAAYCRVRGLDLKPDAVVLLLNGTDDLSGRSDPAPRRPEPGAAYRRRIAPGGEGRARAALWKLSELGSRRGLWLGWAQSEPNGIWIQGRIAGFGFRTDPDRALEISLEATPLPRPGPAQSLELEVNGRALGAQRMVAGIWSRQRWRVEPAQLRSGINVARLRAAWALSPQALTGSPDPRLLSAQVRAIGFSRPVERVDLEDGDRLVDPVLRPWVAAPDAAELRLQLEPFQRLESASIARAIGASLEQLSQLDRELERRRVPWILAALPHPIQLAPDSFAAPLARWRWAPEGLDFDRPQRLLSAWSRDAGVSFLDLRRAMAEAGAPLWDPALDRWLYPARRAAADSIAAELRRLLTSNS